MIGVGLLPYSERLETLKLTIFIERRTHVDLIKVFKAKKEFSSINGVFKFGISGMNFISTFNNYYGVLSAFGINCHLLLEIQCLLLILKLI